MKYLFFVICLSTCIGIQAAEFLTHMYNKFVLDRNALYDSLVIEYGEKNQAGR